ncbi:MAG: tyrosine-type recombinase/integrase [Limisphaerales bacterium]
MNTTLSRKQKKAGRGQAWPRHVQPGRAIVAVYRRQTPSGNPAFMVANYADGKRRFDSYASEADALDAADKLARRLDSRDYVAANMTRDQAIDYASATQALAPFNVTLAATAATMAECLKVVGNLDNLSGAVKFYAARNKQTIKKPVADVVAELLAIKESRGASVRYMGDLRSRLNRFAADCRKDTCNLTTADVQAWLDGQRLEPQGYMNYRRVLHLLFEFAVARSFASDNPVANTEHVKVRNGDVEVFTPIEIARLLTAASPDFLPCIAIGAFAGLRSAEIERLEWKDIDLAARHIVVGASRAKTASRRIVPIADNLAAWLAPYADRKGKVWPGGHDAFYDAQQETAAATASEAHEAKGMKPQKPLEWKANALRHSYASYRFALTGDAGRVAGELGNSAAVVHRHYRELVKPADAERWFNVKPERPPNILAMPAAAVSP